MSTVGGVFLNSNLPLIKSGDTNSGTFEAVYGIESKYLYGTIDIRGSNRTNEMINVQIAIGPSGLTNDQISNLVIYNEQISSGESFSLLKQIVSPNEVVYISVKSTTSAYTAVVRSSIRITGYLELEESILN